ncbi:hypothetical protein FRC02_005296 [Tulasnella sp. 418]|nr:hypothetical protein FRC02_005296 [Tulasnella sp. 418]
MPEIIKILPYPSNLDYTKQSYEVPGTKRPGQTGHYRDALWAPKHFGTGVLPGKILPDLFESGLAQSRDLPFLGRRVVLQTKPSLVLGNEYVWETYAQVDVRRKMVGSALEYLYRNSKLGPKREFEVVGIWSINRPEWQIIDLACQAYRKVSVSLYDTLGPDAVEYIINHAEIPIIFATAQHLPSLLSLSPKTPTVKVIVSIDPLPEETRKVLSAWGKEKGIEIFDFKEIEELGKAHHQEPIPPASPDEVTSICYTSGTTNVPKGVVLTHKNLVSAALSNAHGGSMVNGASMISYLPLAHIYERVAEIVVYAIGGRIGYYSGDPLRLIEDTQILKPYWFPSVPRVLNRLYMAAMQNTKAPGMKGALFRRALDAKLQNFNATGATTHRMWDALVFKKVRAVLGGEIGFITSGSAPISKDCLNFLRIAFAPAIVIEDEKNTKAALDSEGWFHTGDVAEVDSYGRFKIIDRIKNIMKLAQGEYIALEKVENVYTSCPIIGQIYVHGDSLRDHLVAVVVPDPAALEGIGKKYGYTINPTDLQTVKSAISDDKVIKDVLAMMTNTAKHNGLKGFELVKNIHMTTEPFSVENGLLTPTFKIRRRDAQAMYKAAIDELYKLSS